LYGSPRRDQVKCDGDLPCGFCVKKGVQCTYFSRQAHGVCNSQCDMPCTIANVTFRIYSCVIAYEIPKVATHIHPSSARIISPPLPCSGGRRKKRLGSGSPNDRHATSILACFFVTSCVGGTAFSSLPSTASCCCLITCRLPQHQGKSHGVVTVCTREDSLTHR
jgi:hypothetical protein